jgi:hypothetical protein
MPRLSQLYVPQGQFSADELKGLRDVLSKAKVEEWPMDAWRYRRPTDATTAPTAGRGAAATPDPSARPDGSP